MKHGTREQWLAHVRNGETPCDACAKSRDLLAQTMGRMNPKSLESLANSVARDYAKDAILTQYPAEYTAILKEESKAADRKTPSNIKALRAVTRLISEHSDEYEKIMLEKRAQWDEEKSIILAGPQG